MENLQNIKSIIELVITKSDAMCKIFTITFHGSARVWYHSFKPGSILSLHDLYVKLISHFNTSIPAEKSTTKLFVIIQRDVKNTRAYL